MKGGSIVTVPGSSIKLLEPAQTQEQASNSAFMSSFERFPILRHAGGEGGITR